MLNTAWEEIRNQVWLNSSFFSKGLPAEVWGETPQLIAPSPRRGC